MKKIAAEVARIAEETRDKAQERVSARNIVNQLPTATLPPTGNTGTGYTAAEHNHTSSTDGGKLTNDAHDGYSVYEEISAPSTPASDTARLYAKDKSGVTELFYKNSSGTERDLSGTSGLGDTGTATYLDFTNASAPGTPASGKTRIYTKTDKAFYQKDDAGTETSLLTGGGSGNITSTGALGSEPGSPAAGDLYFPDNGFVVERYSGSVWIPWGPIYPLTAPVDASYAWVNQGSASVSTTGGGILLSAPSTTGNTLRVRKKSAPSTPYTVTAMIQPSYFLQAIQSYGLCFRESSSGKLQTFGIQFVNPNEFSYHIVSKWDDATTYNSEYNSYTGGSLVRTHGPLPLWLRVADDATDRICSLSYDGLTFVEFARVGRTNFLTANEVGWFVRDVNGQATSARLLSWKEA